MKIYYVANARMPSEKAHGIQIAKMCEAFIEEGLDLTLVVPTRRSEKKTIREYYNLRVDVPTVRLPAIDWYLVGRLGYFVSSGSFMISSLFFLLWKRIFEKFILYTVDLDNFSSSHLAFVPVPIFSEMHGAKLKSFVQKLLFTRVRGIIAINSIIVSELKNNFSHSSARYIVEPNGVDSDVFKMISKEEARRKLKIPLDEKILLYAGRFFAWKGLEIIPKAAEYTHGIQWYLLGGEEKLFEQFVQKKGTKNLIFVGSKPYEEVPLWLSVADAVLVLGTARDVQSYRYTSPMKLFEYLSSGCTIIAGDTPAIREIVSEKEVFFYKPDDAEDLARVVEYAVKQTEEQTQHVEASRRLATSFSWRARAKRIARFIEEMASV